MDLQQYFDKHGLEGERALAAKAELNDRYLYQIRVGIRQPSINVCAKIVAASGYVVTLRGLLKSRLQGNEKTIDRYWNGKKPK